MIISVNHNYTKIDERLNWLF